MRQLLPITFVCHPTCLGSMVSNPDQTSDIIFPLATDEEIEPDDLCPMKTPKVIEETGVDLEHHWKNRINDIVLCIIVPIDSKYGSGKYRRLGRQTYLVRVAPDCNRSYCEDSFSGYSGSV